MLVQRALGCSVTIRDRKRPTYLCVLQGLWVLMLSWLCELGLLKMRWQGDLAHSAVSHKRIDLVLIHRNVYRHAVRLSHSAVHLLCDHGLPLLRQQPLLLKGKHVWLLLGHYHLVSHIELGE